MIKQINGSTLEGRGPKKKFSMLIVDVVSSM